MTYAAAPVHPRVMKPAAGLGTVVPMASMKPPRNVLMVSMFFVGFVLVALVMLAIGIGTSRF